MNLGITKLLSLFLSCNLFLTLAVGQNQPSMLSGVINQYSPVRAFDYCKNAAVIDDTSVYEVGQSVILIQMQGAAIDIRNEPTFGQIINARNAGKYEKATIFAINQDTIFFQNSLLNTYEIAGKVQIVSLPTFENAMITDTLKALPWDGEKGGIIALKVNNLLTMNAPMIANRAGFRGGKTMSPSNSCLGGINNAPEYEFSANDWRGAAKGEGIAAYVTGKENGKGPQANGGGGGNDHNSGGAGGSHVSRGGNGGSRLTPAFSLACRGNNPGLRGYALADDGTRVYFGGGGGAGHTNNSTNKNGGNGGGIIIVEANNIAGNNQVIAVNGGSASEVTGDGGSGGGAGGTIVLLTNNVQSNLQLELKGGDGARASNEDSDTCFGPGGGGSGGRLLTNLGGTESVAVAFEGGSAGQSVRSSTASCSNTTNGAGNGELGIGAGLSVLPESTNPIVRPMVVRQPQEAFSCIGQNISIAVEAVGGGLRYQWQINRGTGFVNLSDDANFSNTNTSTLSIRNVNMDMENFQFQLLINSECFGQLRTTPIPIVLGTDAPVADFSFDNQGEGVVIFTNNSQFADGFIWDFGGGVRSTSTNTSYTFPSEGEFPVSLIASNQCGMDTLTTTIRIVLPPQAGFNATTTTGCAPLSIPFNNVSSENTVFFTWLFPGGTPNTSNQANPMVTYSEPGTYDVSLVVSNETGSDTLTRVAFIKVDDVPDVNFLTDVNDLFVKFTNTTSDGTSFQWDFGDDTPLNTQPNPEHTYSDLGSYEVTLIATNACGENRLSKEIAVGSAPLALFAADNSVGCAPLTIQFIDQSKGSVALWEWEFEGGQPETSTERNPTVTYNQPGEYNVSLKVINELGQDTSFRAKYIKLAEPPVADFDFTIEDGIVNFTNLSEGATLYSWGFGDGGVSIEESPTHRYKNGGIYYVTLNAYNRFCATAITIPVNIIVTSLETLANGTTIKLYPNPVSEWLNVQVETSSPTEVQFRLFDWTGRLLESKVFSTSSTYQSDWSKMPSGAYFVQLTGKDWQTTNRIIKQ